MEEKKSQYGDSTVRIGQELWTIKYFDQVLLPPEGKYVKAARFPKKREIHLSLSGADNRKLSQKEVLVNVQKAVLPMVIDEVKKKHPADRVDAILNELGYKRDDYGI